MAITTSIVKRRLAAIFCADVEGYSRLMSVDEVATLRLLASHREIMDRFITQNGGRIANTAGDSILAEFPSAMDALQCALSVQERITVINAEVPEDRRVAFRIGIHVGEAMVRDGDLFGDSVNVAARMQSLSHPGLVCLSAAARDYVHRDFPVLFEDLGPQRVKNIDTLIHCYLVRPNNEPAARSIPPIHRRNEANLIRRCYDLLRNALLEVTSPEEMEPVEAAVLASLLDASGADAEVLASRAGVDVRDVRRILKHLVKLGLVEPHTKPGRKRDATWRITSRGIDVLQRSLPGILAAIDRVLAPLSDSERETLLNLLARVIQANEARG